MISSALVDPLQQSPNLITWLFSQRKETLCPHLGCRPTISITRIGMGPCVELRQVREGERGKRSGGSEKYVERKIGGDERERERQRERDRETESARARERERGNMKEE